MQHVWFMGATVQNLESNLKIRSFTTDVMQAYCLIFWSIANKKSPRSSETKDCMCISKYRLNNVKWCSRALYPYTNVGLDEIVQHVWFMGAMVQTLESNLEIRSFTTDVMQAYSLIFWSIANKKSPRSSETKGCMCISKYLLFHKSRTQ